MSTALPAQTGPKSAPGKAGSAANALKHGLTSLLPVLPGVESADDWERHLTGVAESLLPQTHLEEILTERIALILWRLRRVARYEREVTLRDHDELEAYYVSDSGLVKEAAREREWEPQTDCEARPLSPAGRVALLQALRNREPVQSVTREAGVSLLQFLAGLVPEAEFADVVARIGGAQNATQDAVWPFEMLRKGIEYIGDKADCTYWQVLYRGLDAANPLLPASEPQGWQRFVQHRAARLLPDPEMLASVVRYEAHLNRQFRAALHELEALQARVDVDGLPERDET